jgi:hypothetical protein
MKSQEASSVVRICVVSNAMFEVKMMQWKTGMKERIKSRVLRGRAMNKEQVIALLYTLSDEYIATNYTKNANDAAYYEGLKDGIEGFRRYMLYYLQHCCEDIQEDF